MKRFISLFTLLFILSLALISCGEGEESFPVMLSHGDGVTVEGDNPVMARRGEDVSFKVTLGENYIFHSSSEGHFDIDEGILTVKNVRDRMNISFYAQRVDYNTTEEAVFFFDGARGDTDNVDGFTVKYGTVARVRSNNFDGVFLGWSFGKSLVNGGTLASTERVFEFRVTPELTSKNVIRIYANYSDAAYTMYRYDANGGVIDALSDNMQNNDYYTARASDSLVTVTLSERYYKYAASASTFWDDGTFTREGYVLREYNTEPDGSGEGYSLGSKFYAGDGDGIATLYCIWEEETPASDFTVAEHSYPSPVARAEYAPDWHESGVIITEYLGNAQRVTVPEMIDGKYVIAIAEGAFTDKALKTLTLSRHMEKIEDGAFTGCAELTTVYYPDGLYSISDAAFGPETYKSLKNLYVNASVAPRFSNTGDGAFGVKLSRLLETSAKKQIIVVSGSSSYEGLATDYLEALLSGEYEVVNFGTTRTTHGLIYLEAMQHYADDDDIVIFAPENSAYMMGEREMYWKTLRDLENINNFFRYVDISNYTGVFTAFADFNKNYKYKRAETKYELIADNTTCDKNGDFQRDGRDEYDYPNYIDAYFVTMNERWKSKDEGQWNQLQDQINNKDYTDPDNKTWQSIDEESYVSLVNHAIACARRSGAKVYFGFCPVDHQSLVEPARNIAWLEAYDRMIEELYDFDLSLGTSRDYIFDRKYFYDCAFHTNDYGRVYRTYRLYLDLAKTLGIESPKAIDDMGTYFAGCAFEDGSDGTPKYKVTFGGAGQ